MKGYVKLYRSMLSWEWMDDPITVQVFVYCLLRANYEMQRWHGIIIKPGQFVTSLGNMAKDLKITKSQLRTALKHLKLTHSITQSVTQQATVITIEKWGDYQSAGEKVAQSMTRCVTSQRHADDTPMTTDKEIEEIKESKEEREIREKGPADFAEWNDDFLKQAHEAFAPIKAMLAAGAKEGTHE